MIDGVVDFSILVGTLLVVLAFWGLLIGGCVVFYRRLRSPLTRATFVIVPLFILDGLVAGQGILSTVTFLVGFGAQLLLAPVAFARRRSGLGRRHLGAGLFYAASILATVVWLGSNNRLARERADEIILACHRYEAAEGSLPASLDELAPAYLARVPRAKHTLGFGKFEYTAHQPLSAREDADPPFGRAVYFFENDRWIWID